MTTAQFEQMNQVLAQVVQFLMQQGMSPILSGSFALCAYAGKVVGDPQDIDFLFKSREEHDRAVSLLEQELSFARVEQLSWESDTDAESINTKLRSPDGIVFDLACTIGDISLSLDSERTIRVLGYSVPILSLEDLKKSYQRFFEEKPGSQRKIDVIEGLLVAGSNILSHSFDFLNEEPDVYSEADLKKKYT